VAAVALEEEAVALHAMTWHGATTPAWASVNALTLPAWSAAAAPPSQVHRLPRRMSPPQLAALQLAAADQQLASLKPAEPVSSAGGDGFC